MTILKPGHMNVNLGDTGALKIKRTTPATIAISIVEGAGMNELATVQLTNERGKQLLVTLCKILEVPFNVQ